MKKTIITIFASLFSLATFAQKSADIEAIKGQCGCFDVRFSYAETFAPAKDYVFHDRYKTGALEYVFVDEESKNKLVLMHLLVINDTLVIKHWREDWVYQNTNLLAFDKGTTWKPKTLSKSDVKGQWTQKVFEVNDSPRYEGTASWSHVDGKHIWANITDAPLPRREYTKRSDYQVLRRNNRIQVTDAGYMHEQDNDKIIRNESGDKLLAQEKGWNEYKKTDEAKCKMAMTFWKENREYWVDVRNVWGQIIDENKGISYKIKSDNGKSMWSELDNLVESFKKDKVTDVVTRQKAIRQVLNLFLTENNLVSQN